MLDEIETAMVGGGVAMYIRNSLTFIRRNDLETDDAESIWIEMKYKQRQPVIIGSIYRPPSSPIDFIDKLGDIYIIDRVSCECKETIVTGDFNYDVSGDDSSSRGTCLRRPLGTRWPPRLFEKLESYCIKMG